MSINDCGFLRQCFNSWAFIMRLRSCFPALLVLLVGTWASARAEVDDNGNLIATPREAAMMERGFLFYPPRVVRKTGNDNPSSNLVTPGKDKSVSNTGLIQAVVTPVPQPTLVPKPASPEPVAAAPVPSIADEMVKVDPPSDKPDAPAPPANDKILQADSQNRMSAPERASKITAYAGAGTSVVVGFNMPSEGGLNYRVEYSDGFKAVGGQKTYGSGKYIESNTQQRLGLFVDWSPYQNNWALTGGVTINNHQFKLKAIPNSTMMVNNTSVAIGAGTFDIDYSLPKVTPYMGVRYAYKASNDKGWEGFAEVGAVLSKMNAEITVSTDLYPGTISKSELQAEADSIRKSIYKWGVVPNALVGLSYRY